jgi:hypothetical protein
MRRLPDTRHQVNRRRIGELTVAAVRIHQLNVSFDLLRGIEVAGRVVAPFRGHATGAAHKCQCVHHLRRRTNDAVGPGEYDEATCH